MCQSIVKNKSQTSNVTLTNLKTDTMKNDEKNDIKKLFSNGTHVTATLFSFFDHPEWIKFFAKLRLNWKVSAP